MPISYLSDSQLYPLTDSALLDLRGLMYNEIQMQVVAGMDLYLDRLLNLANTTSYGDFIRNFFT